MENPTVNENKIKKAYPVSYPTIDSFGRLRITQLMNWCIELSFFHLESVGIEGQFFEKQKSNWIVNEFAMNFERYPVYKDQIIIEAYSTTFNKYFMYRTFDFFIDDNHVGSLVLSLSLIHLEKRKITSIPVEVGYALGATKSNNLVRFPVKSKTQERNILLTCFEVHQSDIDYNQHVTNSSYFKWIFDTLSINFLKDKVIQNFLMRFETEITDTEFVYIKKFVTEGSGNTEVDWEIGANNSRSAIASVVLKSV